MKRSRQWVGRRSIFAATAAGLVALSCGSISRSSSIPATCAQGDETQEAGDSNSCRCSITPFGLYSWQARVANCDDPGPGDWACFYDLNTAGQSTTCLCYRYLCVSHGSTCSCGYGIAPQQAMLVDMCPPMATCCAATSVHAAAANELQNIDECDCGSKSCGSGSVEVSACDSTPPAQTRQPLHVASNCAGIVWAPPPMSSSSDGG
jgi:hypothetical protein